MSNMEIYASKQPDEPLKLDNSAKVWFHLLVLRRVEPITEIGYIVTVDNDFAQFLYIWNYSIISD